MCAGWFIVNVALARVLHADRFGGGCRFDGAGRSPEFGIND
jgi:hypothetical protein